MDPVTLGVAGLALFALLKGKGGAARPPSSAAPAPAPAPGSGPPPGGAGAALVSAVTNLGGLDAGVAAAKVIADAKLAEDIDKLLTGDKGTGLAGALLGSPEQINPDLVVTDYLSLQGQISTNPLGVYAYNGGRVLGRELDQALGGDGQSETGKVAQYGLGASAYVLATVGAVVAAAFVQVTLVVYAIGSIVSDLNRLSYGQTGATEDYWKEWDRLYWEMFDRMRRSITANMTTVDFERLDAELDRVCTPFVDGWMAQQNEQAFKGWMKRGRGLTVGGNDAYHAQFGYERGYFVGTSNGFTLDNAPGLRTRTPEYYLRTTGLQMAEVVYDDLAERMIKAGRCASNANAYYNWMLKELHGAFVDDQGHFDHGLREAHFEGIAADAVDRGGRLYAEGYVEDAAGLPVFSTRLYDFRVPGTNWASPLQAPTLAPLTNAPTVAPVAATTSPPPLPPPEPALLSSPVEPVQQTTTIATAPVLTSFRTRTW